MENADIKELAPNLSVVESACLCAGNSILQDEAVFAQKRQECQDYADQFLKALTKSVEHSKDTLMEPMTHILQKYEGVVTCIEEWKLKDIEWVFSNESEKEINADFDLLKGIRKNLLEFSNQMNPVLSFQAQSSSLQDALKTCKETHEAIKNQFDKVAHLAVHMLFTDTVICNTSKAADVDKNEKYAQKYFGIGKSILAGKLKELVKDVEKKTGEKPGGGKSDAPKSKKDAKKENEKEKNEKKKRKSDQKNDAKPKKSKKEK